MSAVSSAASLAAAPIAIPRSAFASAGASFTPSPTIATLPNRSCRRSHGRDFVLGKQLGVKLVHADGRGDRLRRSMAVAGQHHDGLDALTAQLGDRVASGLARPIGHGDDADRRALGRDEDRRPALRAHLVETIVNARRTQAAFLEETMIAQQHMDAAHVAFGAQP